MSELDWFDDEEDCACEIAKQEQEVGSSVMKYKVGDKVRVRKDLKYGAEYGEYKVDCNVFMAKKAGKIVTIKNLVSFPPSYKIKEEGGYWVDEMFEGLAQPEKTVKLYTWQDLCDYEILLHEQWRIANEQRQEHNEGLSVLHTLQGEYLDAIKRMIDKLGHNVPENKVRELGF